MSNLADRLAQAREHVDAGFDARDAERGVAALERRIARRRHASQAGIACAAAAVLALAFVWRSREQTPLTAAAAQPRTLTTHDGSVATPGDADSVLALRRDALDEVALELTRGRGHFEVTPNRQRRYRVRAGSVDVEVLGTAFEVERQGERVRVAVEHGVVRVGWRAGSTTLRAGESGTFPPLAAADPASAAAEPAPPPTAADVRPGPPAAKAARGRKPEPAAHERWRTLARAGKHREAFGSLGQQPVEDLPGLLLAADAARLSGHPREAASFLQHLVERYPESPSAPLAAFTLGRLALYELKQPALAARSFGKAYALHPDGAMAEDATAREAEAYHLAADAQRSKSAAERYLQRYPKGARRQEMLGYAGR